MYMVFLYDIHHAYVNEVTYTNAHTLSTHTKTYLHKLPCTEHVFKKIHTQTPTHYIHTQTPTHYIHTQTPTHYIHTQKPTHYIHTQTPTH